MGSEETIELWQSLGIPVVLIDPPEFIGSRLSHGDYEKAWSMVRAIANDHGLHHRSFLILTILSYTTPPTSSTVAGVTQLSPISPKGLAFR